MVEPMLTPPQDVSLDDDELYEMVEALAGGRARHQMFGTPMTVEGQPAPDGHRLFLQFDGDPLVAGPELGGESLVIWTPAPAGPVADFGRCIIDLDSR